MRRSLGTKKVKESEAYSSVKKSESIFFIRYDLTVDTPILKSIINFTSFSSSMRTILSSSEQLFLQEPSLAFLQELSYLFLVLFL